MGRQLLRRLQVRFIWVFLSEGPIPSLALKERILPEGGLDWKVAAEGLRGGNMDTIPDPDGDGIIAATSEGELLVLEGSKSRTLVSGLPCISAIAFGD